MMPSGRRARKRRLQHAPPTKASGVGAENVIFTGKDRLREDVMIRQDAKRVSSRWMACAVLLGLWAAVGRADLTSQSQQPVFRSDVDVIAVDVQVVDRDGEPIPALGPDKFTVTVDGRRRRVVTAELVSHSRPSSHGQTLSTTSGPRDSSGGGAERVFVLAVDVFSFNIDLSRAVVAAAKGFIDQLGEGDLVGLYTFPVGVRVAATSDHAAVRRQIDGVVGQQNSLKSAYNLSVTEIVDIVAEDVASGGRPGGGAASGGVTTRRVMARECLMPTNLAECMEDIQSEAQALVLYLASRIDQGVSGLRSLVQYLGDFPGRKTVVLLSGGMPVADRLGGRVDMAELARSLGQDAARAHTVIYAVHVDSAYLGAFSPERRRYDRGGEDRGRESAMNSRMLDALAGASGGTLLSVLLGGGELAFSRILRETSSHYLLGVEPAEVDRGGLRRLEVKVSERGATVRSRQWVMVPKRGA
jgi:VWFA-related protein